MPVEIRTVCPVEMSGAAFATSLFLLSAGVLLGTEAFSDKDGACGRHCVRDDEGEGSSSRCRPRVDCRSRCVADKNNNVRST